MTYYFIFEPFPDKSCFTTGALLDTNGIFCWRTFFFKRLRRYENPIIKEINGTAKSGTKISLHHTNSNEIIRKKIPKTNAANSLSSSVNFDWGGGFGIFGIENNAFAALHASHPAPNKPSASKNVPSSFFRLPILCFLYYHICFCIVTHFLSKSTLLYNIFV